MNPIDHRFSLSVNGRPLTRNSTTTPTRKVHPKTTPINPTHLNVANLNVLVMTFALPAALFTAISRTPQRVIIENGKLMLVLTLAMLTIFVVELLLQYRVFRVEPGKAAVQTLTVALPNYASVGLPLLGSVFGPQSALSVAVAIAVGAVTVTPLTLVLLENASAKDASESPVRRFFKATVKSLRRPIFWARCWV